MAAKLKIIRARDFMQSTQEGEVDFERSKKILVEVARAKRPPADFDVLIDLRRAQWRLSTTDIYCLAEELSSHGDAFRSKLAILVLPGDTFDQAEFFELCAKNRGFPVDTFTNYEDAILWFFQEEPAGEVAQTTHGA